MSKRSAKNLEDLDQYILDDELKSDPQARAKRRQTIFSAMGLVMLVLGLGMVIFGIVEARKFTNNGRWPSVSGTITDTSVYLVTRRRSPDEYCVSAIYSYMVRERTYTHSWTTGDCRRNRADAQSVANSYINGTAPIWYDPTNPDRASNLPIGMEWMIIIWGAGAFIILFAASLLTLAMQKPPVKHTRSRQPARPL